MVFWPFFMFFEIISIIIAWLQLMTLHLNSTNFPRNFGTSYSSGSVLIRNLIFSIEFEIYGKILSEKALCALPTMICNLTNTESCENFL